MSLDNGFKSVSCKLLSHDFGCVRDEVLRLRSISRNSYSFHKNYSFDTVHINSYRSIMDSVSIGGVMKDIIFATVLTLLVILLLSVGGCGYHHWGHGGHGHGHDCSTNHCRSHCK
jgi:hypothetical protein